MDQQFASSIETLIGGTLDTFVVCAGAGAPVARKTVAEVKTMLGLPVDLSGYVPYTGATGTVNLDGRNLILTTGSVGIGTASPGAILDVVGKSLHRGDLTAGSQVRAMDVYHNVTTDGDIYGILVRPTRSAGTAGEVLAVEGYLANTPHTANSRRNIAVTGDARSEKGAFSGSVNIGVWGIATAADSNTAIYGSVGQSIFNDWVGIGLSDDGSVLKPVPPTATHPLHVRDKRTLTASENSTSNQSVLLHKVVDGAGAYSESAAILALRRTITNVTANTGPYLVCDDGTTTHFTVSNAGAITAASTITAATGLRATAGGLTVTAGGITVTAGDTILRNPSKLYFDGGYAVAIGATGNTGTDKDMQFFSGVGGAERMRVKSTGDVGIGTTSPGAKLDVSGTLRSGSYTVGTLPNASANDGAQARVTDSSVAAAGNYGATVAGGGANKVKVFSDGTNWIIA